MGCKYICLIIRLATNEVVHFSFVYLPNFIYAKTKYEAVSSRKKARYRLANMSSKSFLVPTKNLKKSSVRSNEKYLFIASHILSLETYHLVTNPNLCGNASTLLISFLHKKAPFRVRARWCVGRVLTWVGKGGRCFGDIVRDERLAS